MVSPSVAWGYETGASTSNALTYGAVVVASKDFSKTLTIGLGVAVYHEIYETRTYPFLAIEWQIDEHWKLANPFKAGPAGGAGLELTYAFSNGWEADLAPRIGRSCSAWTRMDPCRTASASRAISRFSCGCRTQSANSRNSTSILPRLPTAA